MATRACRKPADGVGDGRFEISTQVRAVHASRGTAFDLGGGPAYPHGDEQLHAPWRIEYILAPKNPPGEDSVFKKIGDATDDEGEPGGDRPGPALLRAPQQLPVQRWSSDRCRIGRCRAWRISPTRRCSK